MAPIAWKVRQTTGEHNLQSTETFNKNLTQVLSNTKMIALAPWPGKWRSHEEHEKQQHDVRQTGRRTGHPTRLIC